MHVGTCLRYTASLGFLVGAFAVIYYLAGIWGVLFLSALSLLVFPQAAREYRARRAQERSRAEALVSELREADAGPPANRRDRYIAAMQTYGGVSRERAEEAMAKSEEKAAREVSEVDKLIDELCSSGNELTESDKRKIEAALARMK